MEQVWKAQSTGLFRARNLARGQILMPFGSPRGGEERLLLVIITDCPWVLIIENFEKVYCPKTGM